ncbi:MAG: ornithine carbamoyltransferase [Alphaproteobacteria bacterium]|nr:ornithine carbamoyltransferase [Alphaproteobacteria bacterium]
MNATGLARGPKHFLDLDAFDGATLRHLIDDARRMKQARAGRPKGAPDDETPLTGRMLAMIFEKPSTRTRISFEMGMRQLGGQTMFLDGRDMQFGHGETVGDTARVLSRYVDAIMLRTKRHQSLVELAKTASVPVINGLTDKTHPCQLMADILTFEEHRGPIKGRVVTWSGAGNNVCASWIHAAVKFGFELRVAAPPELEPDAQVLGWAKAQGGKVNVVRDPYDAASGSDAIVTDTWVQMSESDQLGEGGARSRHNLLMRYQVNDKLLDAAGRNAIFMHCLPAHRGEEVTDSVLDGPQSVVFDEAENRLHTQKSVLLWALK